MIAIEYQISIQNIWDNAVAEYDIKSTRERMNVIYRHAFFVACMDNTTLSQKSIGNIVNRDHATVIHARKNHNWNLLKEPRYTDAYRYFSELLSKTSSQHDDIVRDILEKEKLRIPDRNMISSYTEIYENKIKRLETKYTSELETLRYENKTLRKGFKDQCERNERLNAECLRLKNLL